MRTRNWCFTDYPDDDFSWPDIDPLKVRYLVAQQEISPQTGRLHWQGYIQLEKHQRLPFVKKLLHHDTHWEPCKGTPEENKTYCTKLSTRKPGTEPVEFGEMNSRGQRTDLDDFKHAVMTEGKREHELVEDFMSVLARYPRLYSRLTLMTRPVRNPDKKVILMYGRTGSGKTKHVWDKHEVSLEFWDTPICNGSLWFDSYDKHKTAVLEEFGGRTSHITLKILLRLLDIYPCKVPTKGGFVWWCPDKVYITTDQKPCMWYDYNERTHDYDQLMRRITSAHCWDHETGHYVHLKTREEVLVYFPYEQPSYGARSSLFQ